MTILLTGGTGFLGGRVALRLLQAGHEVRVLVRPGPRRGGLPEGARPVAGDVTDLEALTAAAGGCEAIVHAAALVKVWVPDPSAFDRINVGGLRNVLEAARRTGVRRVVHTSSFIALGPTDGRVADETQVHPGGARNDYERTKAEADRVGRQAAEAGAPLVTVYPGVIYGAGRWTEGSLMTRTIRDFMRGKVPGYLGDGRGRVCLAFMDDVIEGHLLALERGRPGRGYILGGANASWRELYAVLARLTGAPEPTRRIPFWALSLAGRVLRWRAELTGAEPVLTDRVVAVYRHDWAYSSGRAEAELGYRVTPLEEGLRRTVEWLRAEAA
ncbi:MAG TPA: NAD-dependent epimerase/dehydratase family protein [Candidatus Polarisedimenticolia bacterium]|nr:NAD-dependent epimerase/dehydratase family protein [Candidatus Polarisedimenticolia bacterium]